MSLFDDLLDSWASETVGDIVSFAESKEAEIGNLKFLSCLN